MKKLEITDDTKLEIMYVKGGSINVRLEKDENVIERAKEILSSKDVELAPMIPEGVELIVDPDASKKGERVNKQATLWFGAEIKGTAVVYRKNFINTNLELPIIKK